MIKDVYEELTQTKVEWEWYKHVEDRKGHDYRYAINNWELNQEFPDFKLSNFRQSLKDTVQSYL
jgi:dTDP-D-glucose 4,6-dehydratase